MTAEIAVVIPARNAAATVGAALASVASQTHQPAAVVVVDDASSDATGEVASTWKAMLPLSVIRLDDGVGPGPARHAGITEAGMPAIALLDADDVWLPTHLETLLDLYAPGVISTADAYLWSPERLSPRTFRVGAPIPSPSAQHREICRRNFVFIGSLFGRAAYDEVGGFRGVGAEDWDLWIRMVRAGAVVVGARSPTCLYRLAEGRTRRVAIGDDYLAVLETALREAASDDERDWIERGLRLRRADDALRHAFAAAERDDRRSARRAARGASGGDGADRLQALLLGVAPRSAARLRRRLAARWPVPW